MSAKYFGNNNWCYNEGIIEENQVATNKPYPVTLKIDYPTKMNRVTTLFRLILVLPILALFTILVGAGSGDYSQEMNEAGQAMGQGGGGIVAGLFFATLLMILFRQKYPRWWYDFNLELNRFSLRIEAYFLLLTDRYPSTDEAQSVHLDIKYPNAKTELMRGLPLVKWLLALPHYVVLVFLYVAMVVVTIIGWFAILFTGHYPKSLFDFVVGVKRWEMRVVAYSMLLTTDQYPPFSLR